MAKVIVWNVSPATQAQPSSVAVYGKIITPGYSRELDATWIELNPAPLQLLQKQRMIHVGSSLPGWYQKELENTMKKLTNNTGGPVVVSGKKFSPTRFQPGQSTELSDEMFDKIDDLGGMDVEDLGGEAKKAAPAKEKKAEAPKKEEKKRRAPRRKKKE